ncbi:MAG: hypothetical protein BWZ01_02603 [Deltaproteobacteria bacterium ADurb.BinA179]|nr:MAG: hypothetical protein BWZ01_02603 [Deltaproteobacteria bacterium ADurb.BinA179]
MPSSSVKALKGDKHAPVSLSSTDLSRAMYACTPNFSVKLRPCRPGSGRESLSKASQENFPESVTLPPIETPWPPMNLVREWTTISAPCSKGRRR